MSRETKPRCASSLETKLNARRIINFKNYTFIRNNISNAKQTGETGILIQNDTKHRAVQSNDAEKTTFEISVLQIKIQNVNK